MSVILSGLIERGWAAQGKSTLSNRLVGKERSLTGPEPGLTRDVVRGTFMWDNYRIELQDTAGRMRRNRLELYDDAKWVLSVVITPSPALRGSHTMLHTRGNAAVGF